MHELTARLEN